MKGEHLVGKGNDDVLKVFIEYQYCPYLPINLGAHFKNLEILYIMKSTVSHLTHEDLNGLTKLRIFDVSHNPVKRLHKNYFKGHSSLEIISFYDCRLSFIEKGALEPLVNLKEGHFQFNVCIDYRGEEVSMLADMMEEIKANCEDPNRKDFSHTTAETSNYDDVYDYDFTKSEEKSTTTNKPSTTRVPLTTKIFTTTTTDKPFAETMTKTYSDSFVRRNAYAIINVLLLIIIAFGFVLFKLNAFNRHNWR